MAEKTKKVNAMVSKSLIDKETVSCRGERVLCDRIKQTITLEVTGEFITVCIKHLDLEDIKDSEVYLYIYGRSDQSIWCGNTVQKRGSVTGKIITKWNDEYLCAINCMKSYLGELFLIRPNDLRVFETLAEIGNGKKKGLLDGILRVLFKLSKD